jgi:hypothetical protein
MPLSAQQAEIITIFMEALDDSYLHRLFFVQGEGGAGELIPTACSSVLMGKVQVRAS